MTQARTAPASGRVRPAVLALRCGSCAAPFVHAEGDRAWVCRACGRAWEPERSGDAVRLAACPFGVLVVPGAHVLHGAHVGHVAHDATDVSGDGPAALLAPFWRFGFTARIDGGTAGARAAAEEVLAPRRVFVRAFRMRGAFAIGDPGRSMTRARFDEQYAEQDDGGRATQPSAASSAPMAGITITSEEARRLARLFLLSDVDCTDDVTGLALDLSFESVSLVAVGWLASGDSLRCPVTGARIARALFSP